MFKVVLIIGHSKDSKGAENKELGISEFDFNQKLALSIKLNSITLGEEQPYEVVIFYRENGYARLPYEVNEEHGDADLIISLHANAHNKKVSGCEVLYHHENQQSKEIADIFQSCLLEQMENNNRGVKPITSEDRGGYLLNELSVPAILVEPFFIDNTEELDRAIQLLDSNLLSDAFDKAILEVLKNHVAF